MIFINFFMRNAYRGISSSFLATLIREDHLKSSKSLPAFEAFSIKNLNLSQINS